MDNLRLDNRQSWFAIPRLWVWFRKLESSTPNMELSLPVSSRSRGDSRTAPQAGQHANHAGRGGHGTGGFQHLRHCGPESKEGRRKAKEESGERNALLVRRSTYQQHLD